MLSNWIDLFETLCIMLKFTVGIYLGSTLIMERHLVVNCFSVLPRCIYVDGIILSS